jgi:hypothetical protein
MKLELIKKTSQTPSGEDVIYYINKDGSYVSGSMELNIEKAKLFMKKLAEPTPIVTEETIQTIEI